MAETIRSVSELLDVLFASNQAPRSITEQDVRDAIVSISLETADFSALPRSSVDLQIGRCWIDTTAALRVVTAYQQSLDLAAILAAAGSLFADGQIAGRATYPASSRLNGAATFTANASFARLSISARLNGAGATTPIATVRQIATSPLAGVGLNLADAVSLTVSGPFSSAFSSAFSLGGTIISAQQSASATLAPTSNIIATPQRAGTTTWDPARTSIYITLSGPAAFSSAFGSAFATQSLPAAFSSAFGSAFATGGANVLATKIALDGWYGGVVGTTFKSSGKWYWEDAIGQKVGDTGVGLANPSWPVDNGDPAFGSYLGSDTNSIGLYNGGSSGYTNNGDGSGGVSPMPNVIAGGNVGFALDCVNWKWWARQNGGAWNVGQAGAQDPATNQGGIPIGASYRVGGMAPAVTLQGLNDSVTGRFSSSSWSFVPPVGFSAL